MTVHPGVMAIAAAAVLATASVLAFVSAGQPMLFFTKQTVETPFYPESANAAKVSLAVPYGKNARHVLNFWEAPGTGPRPVVIFFHGGGWAHGDYREFAPHGFINQGISFASVDYRLLGETPLPGPVMDAARALQFLRHNAKDYNIDTEKIILSGISAGGASALYLNYHDDLANPESADPVERESTRVLASVVKEAQTAIDPAIVGTWG